MSKDPSGNLFGGFTVGVYGEGGSFAVQWFSDCQDFCDFLVDGATCEAGADRTAQAVATESGDECRWGGMKPDHRSGIPEQLTVLGAEDGTTAGGEYQLGGLQKFSESCRFALAKAGLAFGSDDFGDCAAGLLFDHAIAILPVPAELFGESGGDAGFSTGAVADQRDDH